VNVAIYSTLIANKLRFSAEDQKLVFYAGLVHDVGDLFIPKRVLYKPARLTPDEMDLIKSHARRGAELLLSFGTPGPVIQTALQHHERVDGAGYPSNTRREEINPFAKIVAISDVYDALTNNRPYERGMTPHEAILKMRTLEGKFDPQILETMTSRR
jgi:HD-GYP domain-containing protein (c-di-GMP phosphodiesterase class II)